jgi:hypothetical protein
MIQQPRTSPKLIKGAIVFLAFSAPLVWLTWPIGGQLDIETRSPDGLSGKLSHALHGNEF